MLPEKLLTDIYSNKTNVWWFFRIVTGKPYLLHKYSPYYHWIKSMPTFNALYYGTDK